MRLGNRYSRHLGWIPCRYILSSFPFTPLTLNAAILSLSGPSFGYYPSVPRIPVSCNIIKLKLFLRVSLNCSVLLLLSSRSQCRTDIHGVVSGGFCLGGLVHWMLAAQCCVHIRHQEGDECARVALVWRWEVATTENPKLWHGNLENNNNTYFTYSIKTLIVFLARGNFPLPD